MPGFLLSSSTSGACHRQRSRSSRARRAGRARRCPRRRGRHRPRRCAPVPASWWRRFRPDALLLRDRAAGPRHVDDQPERPVARRARARTRGTGVESWNVSRNWIPRPRLEVSTESTTPSRTVSTRGHDGARATPLGRNAHHELAGVAGVGRDRRDATPEKSSTTRVFDRRRPGAHPGQHDASAGRGTARSGWRRSRIERRPRTPCA